MSQGSVSIADNGAVTKSGLAGALYDARVASLALVKPPGPVPAGAAGVPLKKGIALDANALAAGIYPEITSIVGSALPPGVVVPYAGSSAPTGWLLCNGASMVRATYAALFAIVGTSYGSVDGTHFNLPDLRGRVPLGVGTGDASDGTAHTLAQKAGTETHTLIVGEMPAHTHTPDTGDQFICEDQPTEGTRAGTGAGDDWSNLDATTTGGGGAHNNLQPYLGLNFIVKT